MITALGLFTLLIAGMFVTTMFAAIAASGAVRDRRMPRYGNMRPAVYRSAALPVLRR